MVTIAHASISEDKTNVVIRPEKKSAYEAGTQNHGTFS